MAGMVGAGADVATYWRRHLQWSDLANQLKSSITKARTWALWLGVVGAVLQTVAAVSPTSWVAKGAALGGAIVLALVPIIAGALLGAESVRKWLRARSVSEGLKSNVFRYLAQGLPFDGSDRDTRFDAACKDAEKWVDELAVELAEVPLRDAPVPAVQDENGYVSLRVTEQISNYYRPKARQNASRARFFRRAEFVIALMAAVLGAVATALQWSDSDKKTIGAWVAVFTTIGATMAAHAAASRYDLQARVFYATARELEDLLQGWKRRAIGVATWAEFVARCEDTISAENRGWMAKLDPAEKGAAK
jgi:hypothetical protein